MCVGQEIDISVMESSLLVNVLDGKRRFGCLCGSWFCCGVDVVICV